MAITESFPTGNGTAGPYSFNFPYLDATDVKVSVNGSSVTEFSLPSQYQILFTSLTPSASDVIRIYRQTDDSNLSATFYPGSAIRSQDLNDNFTQTLYKAQETSNYSIQNADNVSLSGNYTFNGTASGQTPTASSNFATKQYVDDATFASGNLTVGNKGDITVNSATNWTLNQTYLTSADIGVTVQSYDADTAKTDAAQSFTAAQRGSVVALTSGTNISVDLALGNNFSVTLDTNATLDNPTNQTAGQHGVITITQDGTGSRTLAYGANYKFPGGSAPTLSTAAGAVDLLVYYVEDASRIACRLVSDVQ